MSEDELQGLNLGAITDSILEDVSKDFEAFEKVIKFVLSLPEGEALKQRFAAGELTRQEYLEALVQVARNKAGA